MAKVVRGSALIDDFGGVTFTPYDSNPAENSPWTILATGPHGKLQCSRRKVNLVVTFERPESVQEAISFLQRQSATLISELIRGSVQRKYVRAGTKQ